LTQLLVDSHTSIIRGLSLLAPKSRRSRVRWIVAAAFLAVIGVLAADRSTREFATSKGRDFYRARIAAAAVAPPPAAAPPAAAPPAAAPPAAAPPAAATPIIVSVPTANRVVANAAAEPTSPKEETAASPQRKGTPSNRAPKTRGSSRPRTTSSQGGT
jgi:hypothetical protein